MFSFVLAYSRIHQLPCICSVWGRYGAKSMLRTCWKEFQKFLMLVVWPKSMLLKQTWKWGVWFSLYFCHLKRTLAWCGRLFADFLFQQY